MGKVETLIQNYERFVSLPWDKGLAGSQKVWFGIYDKMDERRLRYRVEEFELATKNAGHGWELLDFTDTFAEWMADQDYRESYFESPEDLDMALAEFEEYAAKRVTTTLQKGSSDEDSVVAILGVGSLFGTIKISDLVGRVEASVRGRMLVFFPGEYGNNNYRLLDARDGWNYLAVPITAHEELER